MSTSRLRPTVRNTTVPLGKNSDATSTAEVTIPPGLPRRSRMARRICWPLSRFKASCTSFPAPGPNSSSLTKPVVESIIRTTDTERTSRKSRLTEISRVSGSSRGPRSNRSRTFDPFSPASRSSIVETDSPATEVSFTLTRRSPGWTPDFAAGLLDATAWTVTALSTSSRAMPVTASVPRWMRSKRSASRRDRKRLCGSRARSMPSIAAWTSWL